MSDPRLSRLAQLWAQGLEASLAPAEDAELQGLLADAALAEAWVEAQGSREAEPVASLPMPGRLRAAFQRQFKPWAYWGLRVGLPTAILLLLWAWPKAQAPVVMNAVEESTPFSEAAKPQAARPDLGPPPGSDEHRHLWVTRAQADLSIRVQVPAAGSQVEARILDAQGRPVRVLSAAAARAGRLTLHWDGLERDGGKAPVGRYQVQVYLDRTLREEQSLVVEKK